MMTRNLWKTRLTAAVDLEARIVNQDLGNPTIAVIAAYLSDQNIPCQMQSRTLREDA
jgi:hypothetical protein